MSEQRSTATPLPDILPSGTVWAVPRYAYCPAPGTRRDGWDWVAWSGPYIAFGSTREASLENLGRAIREARNHPAVPWPVDLPVIGESVEAS